jgi:hypothetical protein
MDWIHVAQDRIHWRALVNTVTSFNLFYSSPNHFTVT